MHRSVLATTIGLLCIVFTGCGPLHGPMPPRLDEEGQQKADQSWNDAFSPVDRLDHQALLDAFLTTQAYQIGVDRLTLRSEKKIKNGLVVMEISFDRLKPDQDRFEVSVFDEKNQRIRHERYSRIEVERAHQELFPPVPEKPMQGEPADWAEKREAARKRKQAVEKVLPKWEEEKQKEAGKL